MRTLWCHLAHLRWWECFDAEYSVGGRVRYEFWGCLKCCREWTVIS